ncbi:sigma-54-dependent transcriptional regulator [Thiovibrio frasassiensis]|uniref:Sigma-54 dependent transcriptional regulator n=1 Tax=Thiovibrio frasassiensis TaxID=2984131 RepID=A0A9X4RMW6_9BACT|nr:sigma-54 dependent transcriptional regulator [Thiovibrio frasassiensis]MDG4476660.1 sigma-54 dependent transcriptional regulator [Thiovibrio frasassiensis]
MTENTSQKIRIYILDDEIVTVRRLVQALGKDGYEVEGFVTASEAMARFSEVPADVLVTDVRLNDADGLDILLRVTALAPATKVILMTGYASVDHAVRAMKAGAYHYLAKPFRLEELRNAVRDALQGGGLSGTLESESGLADRFAGIIGRSPAMLEIFKTIRQIAPLNCNVLIQGESGTGKELVAKALHSTSGRGQHPFIPFNCGAFSEELVANELFGHEKGAFTGAVSTKLGLLEAANGGTVFLDEVGEMPIPMQIKLLRVIQERTLLRVGGVAPVSINVRLIAATNRDIEKMIAAGEFRQDLFYRLKVVMINIPPLRKRREDIPLLVEYFVAQIATQFGKPVPEIASDFLDALSSYTFPGNVRELQNIVERAVALSRESVLTARDLPPDIFFGEIQPPVPEKNASHLKALEQEHISEVYRRTGFNQTETARLLGISRTTLWRRLKDLNFFSEK